MKLSPTPPLHLSVLVIHQWFFILCDTSFLFNMYTNLNFSVDNRSAAYTVSAGHIALPSAEPEFRASKRRRDAPAEMFVRDHYFRSMYSNDTKLHILHRLKKIKKWNTYHGNRFKRTTVDHSPDEFRRSLGVTPNTTTDFVTNSPHEHLFAFRSDRRLPFESDLLGTATSPLYLLQRNERATRNTTVNMKWPVKRVVSVEGDVVIGALMMVHSRGDGEELCGPIMPQGGIQALEVMLYTLREINKNPSMPFRIGAHILDDCDTDTYGLEMALDFIKANLHYLEDGYHKSECSPVAKPIWGVVGAPSSITSIQVSNLLRLFKIPMISPFSTSPELSNKQKFDYFCRTIPSDYYQVQVIANIIDRLNWTYVSIIYEESNYGMKGLEELEKVLAERKVCIAIKEKVLKDSGVSNETFCDQVVAKLLTKEKAVGVIVFASDQEVACIMGAVKRRNMTQRFSWIGSDGWSARNLVSDGNEEIVEGTISVQPQAKSVKGFEEYFFNRVPNPNGDSYFEEYWETAFGCRLPKVPNTPFNLEFKKPCDSHLRLKSHEVDIEKQLQFVHQATYGFCWALINMHAELCGRNFTGVCDRMLRSRGEPFLNYVKKVAFRDFSGDEFQFDKNGDGPARYNIVHYKRTAQNVYEWVDVGRYENGVLNLSIERLRFKWNQPWMPESSCGHNCEKGEVKKYVNGDKCCWKCERCGKYEVVLSIDETKCEACERGTKPDSDLKSCVEVTNLVRHTEFFLYSINVTTGLGFFIVFSTFILYVYYFNTPIVKASSREAQILILIGAVFLHVNAYSFLLDPSEVVCSMQSYLGGIGYILIYGTLFWKSYRIVRIFDVSSQCKNLNSTAFVLLVLGLCCIQKIKSVIWTYFVDPRQVTFVYPNRDIKIKLCSAFTTLEMGYSFAYIFPLISIVFCYFRTKKITNMPELFDDSPQIFFCIRFTIVSWIAMFVIHITASDIHVRQNMLALITNLNGSVAVLILFYRSLRIILFQRDLNTTDFVLQGRRANCTLKSQNMEDSHTRENFSQCMMEEFSGDYRDRSTSTSKRDVSVQYSFSSDKNLNTSGVNVLTRLYVQNACNSPPVHELQNIDIQNGSLSDSNISGSSFSNELNRSQSTGSIEKPNFSIRGDEEEEMCVIAENTLKNGLHSSSEEIHELVIKEAACNDVESGFNYQNNETVDAHDVKIFPNESIWRGGK